MGTTRSLAVVLVHMIEWLLTDITVSSGEGSDVIDIQLKTVVLSRPASLQPTPTTPADSGTPVSRV